MEKMIEVTTEEMCLLDMACKMRAIYESNATRKVKEKALNNMFWACMHGLDRFKGVE